MKSGVKEKSGVLLLSHCGFSFMEDLIKLLRAQGRECFVLSSLPTPENANRIDALMHLADWVHVTENGVLTQADVAQALEKCNVVACISVWEGYRALMAWANAKLNVHDIAVDTVSQLTDKLHMRLHLRNVGLSRVAINILTEACLLKPRHTKKFIKPRKGLASYGAFPLHITTSWEEIKLIQAELRTDLEYAGVVSSNEFILEDYIPGREFSFEIICYFGQAYLIAIHEKLDVYQQGNTMLEGACISPALNLSAAQIQQANEWVTEILKAFDIEWGCYHLEAKYDQGVWEVIEINPRVGGAYISESVAALNDGTSMLDLWLQSLLYQQEPARSILASQLSHASLQAGGVWQRQMAAFFQVYFAKPGQVIKNITTHEHLLKPSLEKIFIKPPYAVPIHSREIFLAQLLWKFPATELQKVAKYLTENAHRYVEIEYGLHR